MDMECSHISPYFLCDHSYVVYNLFLVILFIILIGAIQTFGVKVLKSDHTKGCRVSAGNPEGSTKLPRLQTQVTNLRVANPPPVLLSLHLPLYLSSSAQGHYTSVPAPLPAHTP